jgi:transposase InsO family protein
LAQKAHFEVRSMCEVFGASPSAYYEWERQQQSDHARRDAELLAAIRRLFGEFHGRYGAPRLQDELGKQGMHVSRKRVARLMRENGLCAKGRRKYKHTTDSNHKLPVAPNLLKQNFHADQPDTVWVSDITYIWTLEGWMYLAVIIDLFSRKVVGWTIADRMTAALVCDALDAAARLRRPKAGLIFHSDRGSQYASKAFRRRLWRYRMRQSMSAKGNCYDNAVAESFFATLKKELVRDEVFETRAGARGDVFEYIEVFYNRKRSHSLLGYESPTSFEACFTNTNVA